MPISSVGTAGTAGANTATIAPAWPAGTAAGDKAYLFWAMLNTTTPNTPTGFTQIAGNDTSSGSMRTRIYRKDLTGTESGTLTLSNTGAVANRQSAVLIVLRGAHSTTPEDVAPTWRAETVAGTTHASPAITTVTANSILLVAAMERSSTGTNNWTVPTGFTELGDTLALAGGSGGTITGVGADFTARAVGTYTPGVWTSANGFSSAGVGTYTLAIREAPTAAAAMVSHLGFIPL